MCCVTHSTQPMTPDPPKTDSVFFEYFWEELVFLLALPTVFIFNSLAEAGLFCLALTFPALPSHCGLTGSPKIRDDS
jgi:hypothetical protein